MKQGPAQTRRAVVLHIRTFGAAAAECCEPELALLSERLKFPRLKGRYNRPARGAKPRNIPRRAKLWELAMEGFEVDDTEPSSHADVEGEEQYENSRNLKPRGRSEKSNCACMARVLGCIPMTATLNVPFPSMNLPQRDTSAAAL